MIGRHGAQKLVGAAAVVIMTALLPAVALASLSQGYATDTSIANGSLVALGTTAGSVVPADLTNTARLFGVAVPANSTSLSLGGSNTSQVQVVTSGSAEVLVSTEQGTINVGDVIAVSSIAGVGEKAPSGKQRIIGTAQAIFDGSGSDTTKSTLKLSGGGTKSVSIGQIPVVIAVSDYSTNAGGQDYQLPTWLQNFSNQIAGRTVAPIRIVLAGIILLVTLVSVTVLMYAAVRNSIISIGRNPLSRSSVLRGLFEVIAVVMLLLTVSAIAMYVVIAK